MEYGLQNLFHTNALLESKKLPIFLRKVETRDAHVFTRLLSDPRNASDPNIKPMVIPVAEGAISLMRDSVLEPTVYTNAGKVISGPSRVNLVVVLKSEQNPEDEVIGLGGYGAIKVWQRNEAGIRASAVGVLTDADHRGKGYATEAMKLAIDWGLASVGRGGLQLDLVTITTLDDNKSMIKLINDKLGLKGKGVERPAEI